MKIIPKVKDIITFKVNGHYIAVFCMCRPLHSVNEKSVYKKLCKISFTHNNNTTILVTSNMKAAIQLIMNKLDFNTMTVHISGKKSKVTDIVMERNFRLFTIEEIDGKSVYENS